MCMNQDTLVHSEVAFCKLYSTKTLLSYQGICINYSILLYKYNIETRSLTYV